MSFIQRLGHHKKTGGNRIWENTHHSGGTQRMNRECGKKKESQSWVREERKEPEKTNSRRHQNRGFRGRKYSTESKLPESRGRL